jgi:hypothetical protein
MLRALRNPISFKAAMAAVAFTVLHAGSVTLADPPKDEAGVGEARGELSTTQNSELSWRKSVDTKSAYKLGSGFDSFANDREQSQFFGMTASADFRAQLLSGLSFRTKAGATLSSGYAQSRFGDNVGRSSIWFEEATLNLRVLESKMARAYLNAGALNQGDLGMRFLVDRQPFPGVRQAVVIGSKDRAQLKIWAQQTIPTSKTLSTKAIDAEVTPLFTTETIELKLRPADGIQLSGFLTHFSYHNLPSAVALESEAYGNHTDESGPNTSRFKFGFDGIGAGGSAYFQLARNLGWQLGGYVLQNSQAPEGYRNAQFIRTNVTIGLADDIDLIPSAAVFFSEDDVAPGFYNDAYLGHNNRQGYLGAMEVFFQKQRFKLRAEFTDSDVINFNVNQSRQQTLSIGFETFYEIF